MAQRKMTTHIVTSRAQRNTLASPLRLEIIGFFEHGGQLTVRDVAEKLKRPIASMYFHIHKLVKAGLLVEVSTRGNGRSAEIVYGAIADRIAIQLNPRSPTSVNAAVTAVRSALRQVSREFEAAVCSSALKDSLKEDDVAVRRQRVWLTAEDAVEARKRLDAIERFLMRKSCLAMGDEYTWTSLLIPVASTRRSATCNKKGSKKSING